MKCQWFNQIILLLTFLPYFIVAFKKVLLKRSGTNCKSGLNTTNFSHFRCSLDWPVYQKKNLCHLAVFELYNKLTDYTSNVEEKQLINSCLPSTPPPQEINQIASSICSLIAWRTTINEIFHSKAETRSEHYNEWKPKFLCRVPIKWEWFWFACMKKSCSLIWNIQR